MTALTSRGRQKSDRRSQLLTAAEHLIAERGFLAVRLEDIGAAAGVSGPAIYRHFTGKEALLVELLTGVSTRLLEGGQAVVAQATGASAALDGLVEFHLDFALGEPDLIRIQDRDLANLPAAAQRQVRRAQRRYVEIWVGVLREVYPSLDEDRARVMAHAAFGLMNSTPHSLRRSRTASPEQSRAVLRAMTMAALAVDTGGRQPVACLR
ncbi:MAG: TetR/AcrR family transcriptional regulator [Actinobacteria bacterium]|nr:TetR/AcrR family transcriptional regulator [Actinomycetota bacterium]